MAAESRGQQIARLLRAAQINTDAWAARPPGPRLSEPHRLAAVQAMGALEQLSGVAWSARDELSAELAEAERAATGYSAQLEKEMRESGDI